MIPETTANAKWRQSWRRFLRRGSFAAAIRLAGLVCVFALQILLARLIGDTAEYGKYAWGQSLLFLLGAIAAIGLPLVTARFVASLDARQNVAAARRVIAHARQLLLRSTALGPLAALLLWLAWRDDMGEGIYRSVSIVALLFTPAVTFTLFYRDIARARQWLGLALLPLQVARPLLTAALAGLFWWFFGSAPGGTQTLLLAALSVLLVLLAQALVYQWRQRRLPQTHAAVVSSVNQQSMAAAHATGNTRDLQLLATQSAHGSFWPTLLISGFLMLFAAPLLQLFGREFAAASPVLVILVASSIVSVFAGPAHDLLVMTGRQKYIPRVMIFTAIGHVAALLLLLPFWGATGAACASLFSSVLGQGWLMLLARRETGVGTTVLSGLRESRE